MLLRKERSAAAAGPEDRHYFVGGVQHGEITNNGNNDPDRVDWNQSILTKTWQSNTTPAPFRWNTTGGVTAAKMGADGYDPLSATGQGMSGTDGRHTVRAGDSLASIAAARWGDASLWYVLAQANGLTANAALTPGQSLIVPDKVISNTNNASTFRPYDAAHAMGDVSPTTTKPPKTGNKCGVFGLILLAVIAIAVVAIAAPALIGSAGIATAGVSFGTISIPAITVGASGLAGALGAVGGAIVGGAIAGALGSAVSQLAGKALGIQSEFNFKAVGLAAIGGGIGGGLGALSKAVQAGSVTSGVAKFVGGQGLANGVARAVLSSAATQGIGKLTGLQDKISWAGVAGAGIGVGLAQQLGSGLGGLDTAGGNSLNNHLAHLGVSGASMLANAATRSILEGTDFGDNVLAALPDVIGQTVFDLARFGAGPTQAALARKEQLALARRLETAYASGDISPGMVTLNPETHYGSGPGGTSDGRSNPNNPKLPYGLGQMHNQFTEGFSSSFRPRSAQGTSLWSRFEQWIGGSTIAQVGQAAFENLTEAYNDIIVEGFKKGWDVAKSLLAPNVKQSIPVPQKARVTTPAVRSSQQHSFAPFVSPQAQAAFQNSPEPFGALNKSPIEFAGSKLTLDYKQNNAFGGPENPLLAPRGQLYQNKPTTLMQVLAQGYRQNSERPSRSPLARFIGGAIGGDFNDDTSLASTGGKIIGGLNPVSDIRDIAANGGKIWRGEDGGWSGFGWSLVGSIPVVGDGAKAIFKHGDEVVDGIGNLRHGDEAAESATPVMRGIAFENSGIAAARAEAFLPGESVRRLSVRAFDDAGNLLPGRTVLDLAGNRSAGQLGALEFKLNEGVSLTARQAEHFPYLARNGGVVVGENGRLLGLRAGAPIGPLDVQRINGPTLPLTWWPK